jgi:P4 family phage/plasmid primase-like protien
MVPVTAERPCPKCGKPDWCLIAPDGSACLCQRVESDKRCGDAGWLHRLVEMRKTEPTDWAVLAKNFAANLRPETRAEWAVTLGLPPNGLDVFPLLGFNPDDSGGPCGTFPETDAAETIIGINRRFKGGFKKRAMQGSKRGLTLPVGWRDRPGPLFIVEGPTDAAAMIAAGLCVVGRPSNAGGIAHLAMLLKNWPPNRSIIFVGENDRKEDGTWPGKTGTESSARDLAARLGRPVSMAMTPEGKKDARAYLIAKCKPTDPPEAWFLAGEDLATKLTESTVPFDGTKPPCVEEGESAEDPHRLATVILSRLTPQGPLRVRYHRGEFFEWEDGAYRAVPDEDIMARANRIIRQEFERLYDVEVRLWQSGVLEQKPKVRSVYAKLVNDVLAALAGLCLVPATTQVPSWIDGVEGPDPGELIVAKSQLVDLTNSNVLNASPSFFTFNALPFDYDPSAPPPSTWLRFLDTLWPAPQDRDNLQVLQDWFGLLLTNNTSQQKALFLLGPRRSGKGTICRVLRELVGPWNAAGSTLSSLTTNFGLQPLIGKTVVFISDARLSDRADAAIVTERILSISGEDALTIDRKNKSAVTLKLNTRFVIASNEMPKLSDPSGALASRFIVLRFGRSWLGKEDRELFNKLRHELPGILNWAVVGLKRLRERGRLVQTKAGEKLVREMEDLASPVAAFVRDICRLDPGANIPREDLFDRWCRWCQDHGHKHGNDATFGRDLRAALPGLDTERLKDDLTGRRKRYYIGIRLKTEADVMSDTGHEEDADLFGGPCTVQAESKQKKDDSLLFSSPVQDVQDKPHMPRVGESETDSPPDPHSKVADPPIRVDFVDAPSEPGHSDENLPGPCMDSSWAVESDDRFWGAA